jgi:hypothetical protein
MRETSAADGSVGVFRFGVCNLKRSFLLFHPFSTVPLYCLLKQVSCKGNGILSVSGSLLDFFFSAIFSSALGPTQLSSHRFLDTLSLDFINFCCSELLLYKLSAAGWIVNVFRMLKWIGLKDSGCRDVNLLQILVDSDPELMWCQW